MQILGNIGSMMTVPVGALNQDFKKLLEKLTFTNPAYAQMSRFARGGFGQTSLPKKLFFYKLHHDTKSISVPRNSPLDFFKKDTKFTFNTSSGRKIYPAETTLVLREEQKIYLEEMVLPYVEMLEELKDEAIDYLMNCPCGTGKTIMSLYMARVFQVNTLVCVTKTKLGKQFVAACEKFFPEWSVGWEGDGVDHDITIATYALLSQAKYNYQFFAKFGHLILDEYHRVGADSYHKIMMEASCKYRTSLTATFRRKDGLHKILKLHCGEVLEMDVKSLEADIYPVSTGVDITEVNFRSVNHLYKTIDKIDAFQDVAVFMNRKEVDRGCVVSIDKKVGLLKIKSSVSYIDIVYNTQDYEFKTLGEVSIAAIDTDITEWENRNDLILQIAMECYAVGRTTLILSKRKKHIFQLAARMRKYGILVGVIISEKDKQYKQYVADQGMGMEMYTEWVYNNCRVILGIDKMAEEGLDVPWADTLVYAHPIRDIEQSIGRILRQNAGVEKHKPLAFYLADKVTSYMSTLNSAMIMFQELEHVVHPQINDQTEIKNIIYGSVLSEQA